VTASDKKHFENILEKYAQKYVSPFRDDRNTATILNDYLLRLNDIEHSIEEDSVIIQNQLSNIIKHIEGDNVNRGLAKRVKDLETNKKKTNHKERGLITAITTVTNAALTWAYFKLNGQ